MSGERDLDVEGLLGALRAERVAAEPEAGEFGRRLESALAEAVAHLRSEGLVDVEEEHVEALVAEVAQAGLDARSPKQMMRKVIGTLLHSEHVEELYGTDEMLNAALRRFLDPA